MNEPAAGRAPTLAHVAAKAGVSPQTVSNALNSPHLLRAETLARVRAAIEQLGYSPNRAARNLRTRTSHLVGLRVDPTDDLANPLLDRFLHSLVDSCKSVGYHVLLFSSGAGPEGSDGTGDVGADDEVGGLLGEYDDLLRSAAVDAFVITDTYQGNPQAAWLSGRGVPFVAFGRPWAGVTTGHPWVDVDGRAGVALAVDHLVERGHRRIAWVGWQKNSFIGEDRRSGWLERMHEHGLSTSRLSARGEDSVDYGNRAARALLDAVEAPTAFVCASDTVAMGVLAALADLGKRPGRDVAVVGFDDSRAAALVHPGLTSVRQPLEQVAAEVVTLLHARLSHLPAIADGARTSRLLSPTLTVRATT